MKNCFTTVYEYLRTKYVVPTEWNGYTDKDMELFVKQEKRFLAKKQHIGFFKSFCERVKTGKKDDIVLTKTSVGCCINQFAYWVYNEDLQRIEHKILDKDCLIFRING